MKKIAFFVIMALSALIFTACNTGSSSNSLRISFNAEGRKITYEKDAPLVLPDGSRINNGDLKPFWQYIEKKLDVKITDTATQTTSKKMFEEASTSGFKSAGIYGGNSIAQDIMQYGTRTGDRKGFKDLTKYLDKMPDVKKFLEDNPVIKNAITAFDGGIYYLPYIAEIGNYARTFMGRQTWVTLLLDNGQTIETESATALEKSYAPYWVGDKARHTTNVITLQNAEASLDFAAARNVLINYIDATYPTLTNRSDLFLGVDADYDIDELVALWRVMKLAPNTLSKQATGSVVSGAVIVPYFPRQQTYREDILRFANFFGGQRVFGSDSYNSKFYLDQAGELQFSYNNANMLDNVFPKLKAFVSEGLIMKDYDTTEKVNFRTALYGNDKTTNHKQFGFMTYDFVPSTTSVKGQTDVEGILPPKTKTPVNNEFHHYFENTRAIKPDGWGLANKAKGKELDDALKVINFMFTEEGNVAQNYGTPDMIDGEFTAADGKKYPKINDWVKNNAKEFSNGDSSMFGRDLLGINFPLGYQKSIGFELQFMTTQGDKAVKLYEDANVLTSSYDSTVSPYLQMVPSVFSFTEAQNKILTTESTVGDTQVNMIFDYLAGRHDVTTDKIKESYIAAKVEQYIKVYKDAYAAMSKKK